MIIILLIVCLHMYMPGAFGGQKELESETVVSCPVVLGTKSSFSARATYALVRGAITLQPPICSYFNISDLNFVVKKITVALILNYCILLLI